MGTGNLQVHLDWLREQSYEATRNLNQLAAQRAAIDNQIKHEREFIDAVNLTLDKFRLNEKARVVFDMTVSRSHIDRGQFNLPKGLAHHLAESGPVTVECDGQLIEGRIYRYETRGGSVRIAGGTPLRDYFQQRNGIKLEGRIIGSRKVRFTSQTS